jgi:23S rRNA U2552 (ribose-2'-O)-methylase RlmE/FtsJ
LQTLVICVYIVGYDTIEWNRLAHTTCGINVFIMQIDYVKISYNENVHIIYTNFAKKLEQSLHETTNRWKTYGN